MYLFAMPVVVVGFSCQKTPQKENARNESCGHFSSSKCRTDRKAINQLLVDDFFLLVAGFFAAVNLALGAALARTFGAAALRAGAAFFFTAFPAVRVALLILFSTWVSCFCTCFS